MQRKQIRWISLYDFSIGLKAAGTACNINLAFSRGTVKKRTDQHWYQNFRKEDDILEYEECPERPSVIDAEHFDHY
ncbi:hypothetical protein TNCT_589241 [Trichonephila clavata]|uniref:Mos1 transposase HTH domain-containing protein n=1 Tax=Trichonephila clavata TaxID=2740835 RepID=A0A8X6H1P7_TRICU|nr:hypothetical protein TNCT_589241 [Trichonephila clavata]